MTFAIAYTKPGTTLTFWLNRFSWGGHIWSLVRTPVETTEITRWTQPALRFPTRAEGQFFIAQHLGNNPDTRVCEVTD